MLRSFRRSFGRRLAVVLLVGLVFLGRPASAEASFVAMLAHVIEAVNTAIDTWEKHTRIIEDHLDYVGGLTQNFSEVNSAFRTVINNRGLRNRFRIIDVARTEYLAPGCFRDSWVPCSTMESFEAETGRQLDWRIGAGLTLATADYSEWERQIRDTWDGFARLPGAAPAGAVFSFADMLSAGGIQDDYDRLVQRSQNRYHRNRRLGRARQADLADGRATAREFLYHDSGAGGGFASLRVAGNMTGCPAAGATTLLGQAYRADCEDPDETKPGGGDTTTNQHLSDTERRVLNMQMAIATVNADAVQLSLRLKAALQTADTIAELRMVEEERAVELIERHRQLVSGNCPTAAWVEDCINGNPVGDPDALFAYQVALGG